MLEIPEISDAEMVFGVAPPLPAWEEIPEKFRQERSPFNRIASKLFFKGGRLSDLGLAPKEGVDLRMALRALECCLASFEPAHEHKEAGVAFMLSEWFDLASSLNETPHDPAKS